MSIEIKVPNVGESVQEVQVAHWLKSEGDFVHEDESVVELETDKASLEVPAPASGVLSKIVKQAGEQVAVGDTLAYLEEKAATEKEERPPAAPDVEQSAQEPAAESTEGNGKEKKSKKSKRKKEKKKQQAKQASPSDEEDRDEGEEAEDDEPVEIHEAEAVGSKRQTGGDGLRVTPSARRALREFGLQAADVEASGDRLRRSDVLRYVEAKEKQKEKAPDRRQQEPAGRSASRDEDTLRRELEELVPMSLIRKRIAQRLVAARQEAALLTTFNEIDMSAVIRMRQQYGEPFREKYGVKLGFMSFFVKASVEALKRFPEVNAEVRDSDKILYRRYYDIGIAIGGGRGLVVPVLRFAERMSFGEIEQAIADFGERAAQNKLEPDELQGGTFTISNGGVYGSLLSTPIVNPPQSGVLGMHAIEQRPVARDGQVVIRPMMYVALSYDHRIIDGREAVTFLKHIKETIEEPARMLIEV